jgi:ADP-ribose pyrophosphatase YjhB (NUDIX family)
VTDANLAEEAWHASLPGVVVSAGALIGDDGDSVLLVKPNYRDHWQLPGGICEEAEPPHLTCMREVAEELGLEIPVGRMLAVDWLPADARYGTHARPTMHFVFDGGALLDPGGIVLQAEELDEWRFVPPAELAAYLPVRAVRRVAGAVSARREGCGVYVPPSLG